MKVRTHLDFNQISELKNIKIHSGTTAQRPDPVKGGLYYNTTENILQWSDTTEWHDISDVAGFIDFLQDGDGIKFTEDGDNTIVSVDASAVFKFTNGKLDIEEDGITGTHIASSSSTNADRAVNTDHIRDNAVVERTIADGSVSTDKISDNAVTLPKLGKIEKLRVIGRNDSGDSTPQIPILVQIVDEISGTYADHDSLASTKAIKAYVDQEVSSVEAGAISIIAAEGIAVQEDGTEKTLSVDADTSQFEFDGNDKLKISNNAITSAELSEHASENNDRAVGTNHIKDSAVTTGKINNGAVTIGKLHNDLVLESIANEGEVNHNTLATSQAIREFISSEIGALGTLKGEWNASTQNNFPSHSDKGDYWYISGDGDLPGTEDLVVGDVIIAKEADASTTDENDWIVLKTKRGEASVSSLGLVRYADQDAVDDASADNVVVRPSVLKAKVDGSAITYTKTFGTDIVKKYVTNIGNNSSDSITVTHNLGTEDVTVELYDVISKDTIWADVTRSSDNAISVSFSSAPASNSVRVVVKA